MPTLLSAALSLVLLGSLAVAGKPPAVPDVPERPATAPDAEFVSPEIRSYALPAGSAPTGIQAGSDGRLYVSLHAAGTIARLDPSTGRVEVFTPPTAKGLPHRLGLDAAGGVYFTMMGADRLGRLDPRTGEIREYPLGTSGAAPCHVAVAADGTVWTTLRAAGRLARLNPGTGQAELIDTGRADGLPDAIQIGPDGRVWFTQNALQCISALDPASGAIQNFAVPGGNVQPWHFRFDGQGGLWFTEHAGNRLSRLDPATGKIEQLAVPGGGNPVAVALDAAGRVWFSQVNAGGVSVYDPRLGSFRTYSAGGPAVQANGLTIDAQGDVWFTMTGVSRVGRISFAPTRAEETAATAAAQATLRPFREGVHLSANTIRPAAGESLEIEIGAASAGPVEVSVWSSSGTLVRSVAERHLTARETLAVRWDGRNAGGDAVATGVYVVRIRALGRSGSHRVAVLK